LAGTSIIRTGELSEGEGPYDGSTGPIGPCLAVNPGQTLTVQVKNKMDEGMERLGQKGTTVQGYWELAKGMAQADFGFGSPPKSAEDMLVTNIQV
jgi:hypothetical protein